MARSTLTTTRELAVLNGPMATASCIRLEVDEGTFPLVGVTDRRRRDENDRVSILLVDGYPLGVYRGAFGGDRREWEICLFTEPEVARIKKVLKADHKYRRSLLAVFRREAG